MTTLSDRNETSGALSSHVDTRIENLTVICCNCYQDTQVRLTSIGADIKSFYNSHRTRIGNRFCRLEDIGVQRYLYAVTDLVATDKEASND